MEKFFTSKRYLCHVLVILSRVEQGRYEGVQGCSRLRLRASHSLRLSYTTIRVWRR